MTKKRLDLGAMEGEESRMDGWMDGGWMDRQHMRGRGEEEERLSSW